MKSDPNSPRDKGRRRDSKPERIVTASEAAKADDSQPKRLHLLEQRRHRWARRNAHA